MKTKARSKARPHVMSTAAAKAKVLRDDPVMARQIKEHRPVGELLQLLDLPEDEVLWHYGFRPE